MAHKWLAKAERLARVPPLKRGKWHAYRRAWATKRQDRPNQLEVAHAGGWANTRVMEKCYQHARMTGMLAAVCDPVDLPAGQEAQR